MIARFGNVLRISAMALGVCVATPSPAVTLFGAELQLNGFAAVHSGELRLTPDGVPAARGSAFLTSLIRIAPEASFGASFTFRVLGGTGGADGFTLTLQNDPQRGRRFLGLEGGNVGFFSGRGGDGNPLPFGPAFAVSFDTYRNSPYGESDNNHIALLTNASYIPIQQAPAPVDINDGATHTAWIEYDGASDILTVYIGEEGNKPLTPLLTHIVDLPRVLGGAMYVGFTAANGGLTNEHRITSFAFTPPVPEPETYAMVGFGLALILLRLRSRTRQCGARSIRNSW